MKKIFILLLFILSSTSFCFAETDMQKTNRMMLECIRNNLCTKADANTQRVYVDELVWRLSDVQDKENICMFFLKYVELRNSRARFVSVMSSTSGREIASYSVLGYKEK